MRGAWVVLLAVGCGTGGPAVRRGDARPGSARAATAPAPAPRTHQVSPLSYLHDDFERTFPNRVRLARRGDVRFDAADAEPQVRALRHGDRIDNSEAPSLVLVDLAGDLVRVIVQHGGFRLLLWLESSDLHTVTSDTVTLGLEPHERLPAGAARVRVRPGVALSVAEEQPDVARVTHADSCVSFTGWVARSRLGRQYVPIDAEDPAEQDRSVTGGTDVLDRPNGQPIALFQTTCDAIADGDEVDGFVPVVYQGAGFEVRGWVPAAATAASAGGAINPYGGLFGMRSAERFHLPAGTCLFDAREGHVIGVVTEDVDETGVSHDDGWWRIAVDTEWGMLFVWVAEGEPRAPLRMCR